MADIAAGKPTGWYGRGVMSDAILHELVQNSHKREKSLMYRGLPLMWVAGFLVGFSLRGLVGW